jgi:excisionase family DNA binding protein
VKSSPSVDRVIESPYLTSAEAVTYLRLGSVSALYALVREHKLPHGRRGGLYLFDRRELDAWVKNADTSVPTVTAMLRLRSA